MCALRIRVIFLEKRIGVMNSFFLLLGSIRILLILALSEFPVKSPYCTVYTVHSKGRMLPRYALVCSG
jgi:hypothetical protein